MFSDVSNKPHQYCLAVYYLPPNFEPKAVPHGNSKTERPFFPTLPSTMEKIKQECTASGPKQVVSSVSNCVGGVMNATDPCELPRDEQQVSKLKQRVKFKCTAGAATGTYRSDEFAVVMQKAFMEDESKLFIRDVKTIREPAIIVAQDRQLNDLVRFCSNAEEFGIMTVDPTFTLGQFDVTVITYRNLLLQSRRSEQPPVMIGPVMIHYKKTYTTNLHFASTLLGL